jgi:hypothetical protein
MHFMVLRIDQVHAVDVVFKISVNNHNIVGFTKKMLVNLETKTWLMLSQELFEVDPLCLTKIRQ